MSRAPSDLESVVSRFETDHPTEGRALRALLDTTPDLRRDVSQAIADGKISRFQPHPERGGGRYNAETGEVFVPMEALFDAVMADPRDAPGNMSRLVLGHEVSHALHRDELRRMNEQFTAKIDEIARSPSPHDYSSVLKERVQELREREALDEIYGINAVANAVRNSSPSASLKDLYRALPEEMKSYIDRSGRDPDFTYTPKPGLTFDSNLRIDPDSRANVEAMGGLFFDARGYPDRYGAIALYQIRGAEENAHRENPDRPVPAIYGDLAGAGIDIEHVDPAYLPSGLINSVAPMPERDREPAPAPSAAVVEPGASVDAALIGSVRSAVARTEAAMGKPWDDYSERLTASLSVLADRSGFRASDDVQVGFNRSTANTASGEHVFVYRVGADASVDPYANRAGMDTQMALAKPAHQAYDAWAEEKARAHSQEQSQQVANQQLSQNQESQQSPVIPR